MFHLADESGDAKVLEAAPSPILDVAGYIGSDTTWNAGVVRVRGDVKIAPGVTLTIASGARLEFQGHFALNVNGALRAIGTAERPITFTTAEPHAYRSDSTLAGAWNGIRFERTSALNPASRLEHCVIEYAKAARGSILVGPLICEDYSGLTVVNSMIRNNVVDYGGALFCSVGAAPKLVNCVIIGNTARRGGAAVYSLDSHPRLYQCTIAANHDLNPIDYQPAAAVLGYMSKPRLSGCIVWGNTSLYAGQVQTWGTKVFYTEWSDVQGGHEGLGNIDLDPLFVGEGLHAYSPEPASPCVDAGPPSALRGTLPAEDPAGRPRVFNGRIDIGAYEGTAITGVTEPPTVGRVELTAGPNPFNPATRLSFTLEQESPVSLRIIDLQGRVVRILILGTLPAGPHFVSWDGTDSRRRAQPSGTYFAELKAQGGHAEHRLTLLK